MDRLTQDGSQIITTQDFLALHPDLTFPTPIPYAEFGWFVVAPQGQPTYDPITQSVRDTGRATWDGSHWLQQWEVVALDDATIAANRQRIVDQNNARIKAEIAALDLKRIRPLAEGDSAFLATLNSQITSLRAQLA